MMASEDLLDFAQSAITQVAHIASQLGVKYACPICGCLGAELLLVADYLNTAGLDQEERRISKLLKDVERICNVSTKELCLGVPSLLVFDVRGSKILQHYVDQVLIT